ncbi:putative deoxyribonuclease TATDN2 [Pecten maximus]|uniref:putative deoxyribonuclease TATDN2 n=1 Tax=Pecten maximus TaxID=6579 RepID=UPI0014587FE5|nr:putative deoxyribonuclease TATDN2 [Pecten maximus]
MSCSVRVNNNLTNFFAVNNGVKQGCNISPTLCSIYINDLAQEIKDAQLGISVDEIIIGILMYADDIVLLSESEEDMQSMLNIDIQDLLKERYLVAIGVHPKHILTPPQRQAFLELLRVPDVAGFGEVGIDHTVRSPDMWYRQEEQLRSMLPHIQPHQVLILHIRGLRDDPTGLEAYMRCFDVVREWVPLEQKIQLHCFSGTEEVIRVWLERFPNTYFSLSGMVAKFSDVQRRAVKSIPADRLLLETDAPYFPLAMYPRYEGISASLRF